MILRLSPLTAGRITLRRRRRRASCAAARSRSYYRRVQGVFQDPFSSYNPIFKIDRIFAMIRRGVLRRRATRTRGARSSRRRSSRSASTPATCSASSRTSFAAASCSGCSSRARCCSTSATSSRTRSSACSTPRRGSTCSTCSPTLKARGLGILFITHDLSLGNYISDTTVILRHGCIVEMGATREGLRRPAPPVHADAARVRPPAAREVEARRSSGGAERPAAEPAGAGARRGRRRPPRRGAVEPRGAER